MACHALTSLLSLSLLSALPPASLSLAAVCRPPSLLSRFLHALLDPAEDLSGDGKVILLFIIFCSYVPSS